MPALLVVSLVTRNILIVLLLVVVFALPDVAAQARPGFGGSPPQDASLLPDATNEVVVVTDASDDTELFFAGGAPVPPNDYADSSDIESLAVAETEEMLLISLKHKAYPDIPAQTSEAVIGQDLYCEIEFRLNGADDFFFEIQLYGENLLDGGPYVMSSDLDLVTVDPDGFDDSDFLGSLWAALVAGDHMEILLPKEMLRAAGDDKALKIGDELTDFYVQCSRGVAFLGYFDEAGGEGASGSFRVSAASGSGELAILWPGDEQVYRIAVAAAQPTKLNLIIKNLEDRKLLVNVTASIIDAEGVPVPGWTVQSAPTFEINGGNSLPVSLVVRPPADVEHRAGGLLRVQAFPLGFEDKVTLTTPIIAVVSPGPGQNTLYFHHYPGQWFICYFICGPNADMLPSIAEGGDIFAMNVRETDPLLGEEPTEDGGLAIFSDDSTVVFLDAPLSDPLRFAPEGVAELKISLRTGVEREIGLRISLTSADETLAFARQTVSVGQGFTEHTIMMPIREDFLEIPAGRDLRLDIRFEEELMVGFFGDTWVDHVEWELQRSSLTLPLLAVPKPIVNITDGRTLPTLALGNQTDAEEYVNPGATQAFDLFLINEGAQSDVVGVRADVSLPGWEVRFYPGDQYSLEPGSAAPLCFSISAPESAKEGDIAEVNLTAWSRTDAAVKTSLPLKLIVISGVDVEEDACQERSEEEYVKPFTEREKRSPAPSGLLVAVALAGIALWARRRA